MASSIEQILDVIAPKFKDNVNKQTYIDLAKNRTSTCYGESYNEAVALRSAHMLTLDTNALALADGGGPISQKREGDLSISFAVNNSKDSDSDLSQTMYGRRLLGLRKGKIIPISVIGDFNLPC